LGPVLLLTSPSTYAFLAISIVLVKIATLSVFKIDQLRTSWPAKMLPPIDIGLSLLASFALVLTFPVIGCIGDIVGQRLKNVEVNIPWISFIHVVGLVLWLDTQLRHTRMVHSFV
jgi:hypothetical protein